MKLLHLVNCLWLGSVPTLSSVYELFVCIVGVPNADASFAVMKVQKCCTLRWSCCLLPFHSHSACVFQGVWSSDAAPGSSCKLGIRTFMGNLLVEDLAHCKLQIFSDGEIVPHWCLILPGDS